MHVRGEARGNGSATRSRAVFLLGLVVSVVCVALVVRWAARQEPPDLPSSAGDLALVLAAVGVYAAITLVRGWRWSRILRRAGIRHKRRDATGLLVVGYGGNVVLPARGGEVLRVVLLARRSGAGVVDVGGTVLVERLLDGAVLALLFSSLTFVGISGAPGGLLPAVIGFLGVLALATALAVLKLLRRAGRLAGLAERARPLARHLPLFWSPEGLRLAGVTALLWLAEGAVYLLVARALHADIGYVEALGLNLVATFLSLVPAAPGYAGTFDGSLVVGLRSLDVPGALTTAYVVLVRFVVFVPVTVAAVALLAWRYGGVRRVLALLPSARAATISASA